jgi:serralysin
VPDRAMLADAFHVGSAAADKEDRIVYNQAKGDLYYDADGKGGASKVLFAHLTDGTKLGFEDFFVR